jgi:hypothetical protein
MSMALEVTAATFINTCGTRLFGIMTSTVMKPLAPTASSPRVHVTVAPTTEQSKSVDDTAMTANGEGTTSVTTTFFAAAAPRLATCMDQLKE